MGHPRYPHARRLLITFYFLVSHRHPRSTLFPYTTLFRSPGGNNLIAPKGFRAAFWDDWMQLFKFMGATDEELEFHLYDWKQDRKSTRLNSSHVRISYAVFCLKKKRLSGPLVETRGAEAGR